MVMDNRSPVPLGMFASEGFAWLSAVIFMLLRKLGKSQGIVI
jgi:hypothetical protein